MTDVTNIDFCAAIIKRMLAANVRSRPRMRWRVMDMTALEFGDGAFELVMDKGGLDALHADDDEGGRKVASKALAEAGRVLAPGGAYACVTLAETHVLTHLLAFFRRPGWAVSVAAPPPPPDMCGAPLQPLLVTVVKAKAGGEGGGGGGVGVVLPTTPCPPVAARLPAVTPALPNAAQLAAVGAVVREENAAREREEEAGVRGGCGLGASAAPPPAAPAGPPTGLPAPSAAAATKHAPPLQSLDPWAALVPGRVEALPLGPPHPPGREPRYTATVIDAPGPAPPRPTCTVFVVPQGREHEWLFASPAGLEAVARQVGAARVVVVALGRGHTHGDVAAVQADLSPLVAPLAPAALRNLPRAVPIVTAGDGVGWRRPVAAVPSGLGPGRLLVEDVAPPDGAPARVVGMRRLVFAGAAALIQSEAPLVRPAKRAPPAPVCGPDLPAAYHSAALLGVALAAPAILARRKARPPLPSASSDALVVGLGGGGLAAHLAACLGFSVSSAELDPAVVGVARDHFGLAEVEAAHRLRVVVGDGVAAVAAAAAEAAADASTALDALIVDAGGADAGAAMTCPPPPFTTPSFAASARACLGAGGVLVVNCVSRDRKRVDDLADTLKSAFGCVWEVDVPDDVNVVLIALADAQDKGPPPSPSTLVARLGALGGRAALPDPGACVGGPGLAELAGLLRRL